MAETCIVCLGDLAASETHDRQQLEPDSAKPASTHTSTIETDPSAIAHLLPCRHNLHHECLRPWVERANSCPICRASFNTVELCAYVAGPCVTSYAVQEKQQEAEFDPTFIVDDDDLFDEPSSQPCLYCEDDTDEEHLLLCDSCNGAFHTQCVNLLNIPSGPWYCSFCRAEGNDHAGTEPRRGRPRTRGQQRRQAHGMDEETRDWARVWRSVLTSTNIDLDFPFNEEESAEQSAEQRQREWNAWQRRVEVAGEVSNASRFCDAATSILQARSRRAHMRTPTPESQEEIRAWNAYDKVNQLRVDGSTTNGRKRKSATASPAEPQSAEPQRKLKRPRTRLTADNSEQGPSSRGESSAAAHRRAVAATSPPARSPRPEGNEAGPSFLQSLLKEVEMAPGSSNQTPQHQEKDPLSIYVPPRSGSASPPPRSPASSPTSSNAPSPRTRSLSPSGQGSRPSSPPPLSSRIEPLWTKRPQFSPASPSSSEGETADSKRKTSAAQIKSRNHVNGDDNYGSQAKEKSPARPSTNYKEEIKELVSAKLKPLYRRKEISSEQYTNINRDVSRQLYERYERSALRKGLEVDEWKNLENIATLEVEDAINALKMVNV